MTNLNTFDEKDIKALKEYRVLLTEEALTILDRFNDEQINGTYELSRIIPMKNKIERVSEDLIRECLYNWLYENRYALEYLTNGKIVYSGTYELDTYRFHR